MNENEKLRQAQMERHPLVVLRVHPILSSEEGKLLLISSSEGEVNQKVILLNRKTSEVE